jgi:putative acyl-CoA dehydrogenase
VLRAIARTPNAIDVLRGEFDNGDTRLSNFASKSLDRLRAPAGHDEAQARVLTRDLAVALQARLLIEHAPAEVSDAFCASRLMGGGAAFGLLPRGLALRAVVERAAPA